MTTFKSKIISETINESDISELLSQTKHIYDGTTICETETRSPKWTGSGDLEKLIVDMPGGLIYLWEPGCTLRWAFDESSLRRFGSNIKQVKQYLTKILDDALADWGDAVPIKFKYDSRNFDFHYQIAYQDQCQNTVPRRCVYGQAFFPAETGGKLILFPTLFDQPYKRQVGTMIHELGHIFGLRHSFAPTDAGENTRPWAIYGKQNEKTIMNYGASSVLTNVDLRDLKALYQQAWQHVLPPEWQQRIRFVKPASNIRVA